MRKYIRVQTLQGWPPRIREHRSATPCIKALERTPTAGYLLKSAGARKPIHRRGSRSRACGPNAPPAGGAAELAPAAALTSYVGARTACVRHRRRASARGVVTERQTDARERIGDASTSWGGGGGRWRSLTVRGSGLPPDRVSALSSFAFDFAEMHAQFVSTPRLALLQGSSPSREFA